MLSTRGCEERGGGGWILGSKAHPLAILLRPQSSFSTEAQLHASSSEVLSWIPSDASSLLPSLSMGPSLCLCARQMSQALCFLAGHWCVAGSGDAHRGGFPRPQPPHLMPGTLGSATSPQQFRSCPHLENWLLVCLRLRVGICM